MRFSIALVLLALGTAVTLPARTGVPVHPKPPKVKKHKGVKHKGVKHGRVKHKH